VKVTVVDLEKESKKQKYSKNYILNEKRTAYIGQNIISVKKNSKNDLEVQQVNIPEKIHGDYTGKRKLEINSKTYQLSQIVNYDETTGAGDSGRAFYILPTEKNQDDWLWGLLIDENGQIFEKALYCYNNSMLWFPSILTITPNTTFPFRQSNNINLGHNALLEVVYTGKNDVSLNFTYKEYTYDNLARPSFFQNINYEASVKKIRFKGFVLQIHEASNEKLTYSVIEDGLN
jgi:hypothetical protein